MATEKQEWAVRYVGTQPPHEGLQIRGPFGVREQAEMWLDRLLAQTTEDGSLANTEVRLIKRTVTVGDWESIT